MNIDEIAARVLDLIRNPFLRGRMGSAGRELYERHYSIAAYEKNVKVAMKYFLNSKIGSIS
jgi:glycosyltransferase involved in cell wall biosynthesis